MKVASKDPCCNYLLSTWSLPYVVQPDLTILARMTALAFTTQVCHEEGARAGKGDRSGLAPSLSRRVAPSLSHRVAPSLSRRVAVVVAPLSLSLSLCHHHRCRRRVVVELR
jgi:hypothetical protein